VRRRAPRPLSHALGTLTGRLAPASTLADVQRVWPDVAGTAVAAEAEPVAEREGVLEVRCRSAVWAQELELLGPDLVARVNAALGRDAVRSLRCRTGARRRHDSS
jgi:predicted nucleic acid-binding Zn ribbon protein